MDKLKPCPFCGGEAEIQCFECLFESFEGRRYAVECKFCSCSLELFETEEEAVEAWNRRVGDD